MRVVEFRTFAGPNVYSHRPVLVMRLDLEDLTERESYELPHLVERLPALLPGLAEHHCSKGRPGGFLERLREGTYAGHVVEHVAIELMQRAGVGANHGKTRYAGRPGLYNVAVEYKAEQATRHLLGAAVRLVEAVIEGGEFPFDEAVEEARRLAARTELGPSTRAIVEAAERRGIPWAREDDFSTVQLGYGKRRRLIQSAMSDATSVIGVELAGDKDAAKERLEKFSVPVPRGRVVRSEEEARDALAEIGAPVVVKPLDGRQGKGVSLDLHEPEEVARAFRFAQEHSRAVLVEEMFEGRNYRVLVVNYRVVAASERVPCHVVGDGVHTVARLIEIENSNPLRGEGHESPLTKIKVDPILEAFMQKEGVCFERVPAAGERVMLCAGMNLSTGGTARDVTDDLHPTVRSMCERAARVVGLDICGVDLVLEDISAPLPRSKGGVIELNAAPGLRMHHFPSEGRARDAGGRIVDMLFPAGAPSRVPIVSVTGTNGKTTVARMIAHLLSEAGLNVGLTTTDGIYLGGERIVSGDTTGPHSARTILGDPATEVAVLETARGGIVRRGLGYDWSDVSVMTNVSADHIGQDGIESVEDLLWIKSLVAERVREGGTLVLNADDPLVSRLPEHRAVARVPKEFVYFSLAEDNEVVRRHLGAGGTAFFARGGWLVEAVGETLNLLVEAASIPATMWGTADFQIANALAAAAAARALGLSREQTATALQTFRNDAQNPGRANLYRVRRGHVLLDYGHNPEAFASVCRMAARWEGRNATGIIAVPGDRDDSVVEEAGRVAARGFRRIIVREDQDLRGRRPGEVAELLCRAVREEASERECEVVLDLVAAFERVVGTLGPNDVVFLFYDELEPVLEVLARHGAVPVTNFHSAAQLGSNERGG
jgi:cyanophycin synthetase